MFILLCSLAGHAQSRWTAEVRHDHWRGECKGVLSMTEQGLSFTEVQPKKKAADLHQWTWPDDEIQELIVAPGEVTLFTYVDSSWTKLGVDRGYRFSVPASRAEELSTMLRERLQPRLIVRFAEPVDPLLWEVPVKRIGAIKGSQGRLLVGDNRIVFESAENGSSRTWSYDDIENVSTTGPFQLTIATYERDRSQYGSIHAFTFQLKRPVDERRYDDLWLAVNQRKGLKTLQSP